MSTPSSSPSAGTGEYSARKQLDALASGEIDTAAFLRTTLQRFRFDSEESWEVLALLDQYHRLGKIPTEVFREVKVTIGEYAWRPRGADGKPLAKFNLPESPPPAKPAPAVRPSPADSKPGNSVKLEAPAAAVKPAVPPRAPDRTPVAPALDEAPRQKPKSPKPLRQAVSESLHAAPEETEAGPPLAQLHVPPPDRPEAPPTPLTGAPMLQERPKPQESAPAARSVPPPLRESPAPKEPPSASRGAPPLRELAAARAEAPPAPTSVQPLREPTLPRETPFADPRAIIAEQEAVAEELPQAPIREPAPEIQPREIRVGNMLRRRYRIEGVIGSGSVGTVYEATDSFRLEMPPSGQRIAIKVFHPQFARRIETLTELRREFQILQSLSHPNILRAFEFERDHQLAFVTTELLNGVTLERVLAARSDRPLQRVHALAIIRDIASALGYAHSRGVVHGDINPNTVFITARGELRVTDFAAAHKQPNSAFAADNETFGTTAAAPAFASCQVLENDRPRVQDDLYSLACLAVMLLGGRHPFDGRSSVEARIARVRPRRPRDVTARQWHALRSALRFERDKRPADVQEWLKDLGVEHAAQRLPPVNDLVEAPPRVAHRFGFGSAFIGCILVAAACYFVAVENDWIAPVNLKQVRAAFSSTDPAASPPPANVEPAAPQSAEPPVARPARSPATAPKIPTKAPNSAALEAAAQPALPASKQAAPPPPATKVAVQSSPALIASHAKVEMSADSLEVQPGSMAKVLVRRRGSLRGATTFQWWTESGTAKPGKDFVPVLPRVEQMADGQATAVLVVSVAEGVRTRDKSFYVEIDSTDGGAQMGGRTLTMVTLPANN